MTLADWLESRSPEPPALLIERVRTALGSDLENDADAAFDVCVAAAERLLGKIIADSTVSRRQAVDLLAVDALVTYAFEAASSHAETLSRRADEALSRFAALPEGSRS